MMKWWTLALLLLLPMTLSPARALAADDDLPGYEARTYTDAGGKTLPYLLLKPANLDPAKSYPLVLFLHGAGERGSDNRKQLLHPSCRVWGTPENQAKFPCFFVAPQCPEGDKWTGVDRWDTPSYRQTEKPTEPLRLVMELLPALQKEFKLDEHRLYVTGLSMGGYGTWELLNRLPGVFAAAAPICGGADETRAEVAARTPVWVFHGGADPVVLPLQSRRMVEALRKAGAMPKYTEYPGVGHNSWDKAYGEPELVPWMFSHEKAK